MFGSGAELQEVAVQSVKEMMDAVSDLITIYYGTDASGEDARAIGDRLEKELDDVDIEITYGGQPVYYYIISVE